MEITIEKISRLMGIDNKSVGVLNVLENLPKETLVKVLTYIIACLESKEV